MTTVTGSLDVAVDREIASHLLGELADLMGQLACRQDTDVRTAAELLRLRDDLSARLHAAAALDAAGMPPSAALDMLRHGATLTLAGLQTAFWEQKPRL